MHFRNRSLFEYASGGVTWPAMSSFLFARHTRHNGLWQASAPIDPRSARTNCGLLKCQFALFPSDISGTTVSLDNSHGPASARVRPGVQAAEFYPSGRPHRIPGTYVLLLSRMAFLSSKDEGHLHSSSKQANYSRSKQPGGSGERHRRGRPGPGTCDLERPGGRPRRGERPLIAETEELKVGRPIITRKCREGHRLVVIPFAELLNCPLKVAGRPFDNAVSVVPLYCTENTDTLACEN